MYVGGRLMYVMWRAGVCRWRADVCRWKADVCRWRHIYQSDHFHSQVAITAAKPSYIIWITCYVRFLKSISPSMTFIELPFSPQ